MNCVHLWGQQVGDSGIQGWEWLVEVLRDHLVRRCYPANLRPARCIYVPVDSLVQGDIDQVDSKDSCNRRPRQTKDLASKHEMHGSALGSNPGCGIEHSDPVLNVRVLSHLKQSRQPSEVRKVLSDMCPSCCSPQRNPVEHPMREDPVTPPLIGLIETGLKQCPKSSINPAVTAY